MFSPDLILKAGAKLHAVFQILVPVRWRAENVEVQLYGNHQGGILPASFIELEFRGHIHGQHRDLDHVSRKLPTAEEGYCLCRGLESNRVNLNPPSPIKFMP